MYKYVSFLSLNIFNIKECKDQAEYNKRINEILNDELLEESFKSFISEYGEVRDCCVKKVRNQERLIFYLDMNLFPRYEEIIKKSSIKTRYSARFKQDFCINLNSNFNSIDESGSLSRNKPSQIQIPPSSEPIIEESNFSDSYFSTSQSAGEKRERDRPQIEDFSTNTTLELLQQLTSPVTTLNDIEGNVMNLTEYCFPITCIVSKNYQSVNDSFFLTFFNQYEVKTFQESFDDYRIMVTNVRVPNIYSLSQFIKRARN